MFKIGEFSKLTQVSVRMLRYYDETGLLKPAKTDKFTGYRLYSVEQISTLNKIVFLRNLGFSVAEIAAALANWQDEYVAQLLDEKYAEIEDTIRAEREKQSKIQLAKQDLAQEKIAIHYNVTIKAVPGFQAFSLRRVVPNYYAEGLLWKEMAAYAQANRLRLSAQTVSIYHDIEYKETDVDIEVCAHVAKMGKSENGFTFRYIEPVPVMACTMVYGLFENIAGSFLALAGWLQQHNQYQMAGQSRQIVHRGPWNEDTPENYLTEIQVPLIKKGP